ncbi:methionine ABC transporter permease [Weissella paramesenteroides]|uniref:methionine ABC transporter permease n=1 Tax=Weissella paramesenteroides TaxID=1249 RepID=UPI002072C87A|nr:methionine ABC transporter permease [Weissella paramesenteroides]MCM6766273.1 ABC transporter permease [Weissella paramesenteroides]MCM6767649.1 ABC transporter permease [Weissella paramesenteroides]MCM6769910.1 ABC transporter permease [Weissella paramesenteroides]MCM6770364.1 ABC transporter permease [Weissella paramesenteroides]MCM6780287.1 ABC transporter permease [Weissella paramesenteroides]
MIEWIKEYMPNAYGLGWSGDYGWGIAIWQTIYMTAGAAIIGGIIGLLFGIGLVLTADDGIAPNRTTFQILDKVVSVGRAIPFIIMVVAFSPLTQLIVGTTIGTTAALVPLSLGVFPFFARQVQVALLGVDSGKVEAARSFGATNWDIISDVYLREGRAELIRVSTVTFISLVGLTAMAGAIGAGGLGTTAIVTGYQRFQNDVMWLATIIILLFIVLIQFVGDLLAKHARHN